MIKFKAKHLRASYVGYSMHLTGNDGECELIIVTSWGQDGRTRLVIVGAECDGSVVVLHEGKARVTLAQVVTTIDNVVKKWSQAGTKPNVEEQLWLDKQREKLIVRLDKLWNHGVTAKAA
jgi:hypothetical protein